MRLPEVNSMTVQARLHQRTKVRVRSMQKNDRQEKKKGAMSTPESYYVQETLCSYEFLDQEIT